MPAFRSIDNTGGFHPEIQPETTVFRLERECLRCVGMLDVLDNQLVGTVCVLFDGDILVDSPAARTALGIQIGKIRVDDELLRDG